MKIMIFGMYIFLKIFLAQFLNTMSKASTLCSINLKFEAKEIQSLLTV
jgi:hypothetical protein